MPANLKVKKKDDNSDVSSRITKKDPLFASVSMMTVGMTRCLNPSPSEMSVFNKCNSTTGLESSTYTES